jgi:rare lipoprotein A
MLKSRYRIIFFALLILLSQSGCQSMRPFAPPTKAAPEIQIYAPKPVSIEEGIASWYGGKWIGRLTANGEHYRANDFTAAHKKLPFNTRVRVVHLKTGKSIIVRINIRGPVVKGRIIDLSVEAAKKLGTYDIGLAKVRLEVLRPIPIMTSPNLKTRSIKPAGSPSASPTPDDSPKPKAQPKKSPTASTAQPASKDSPKAKLKKAPSNPSQDSTPDVSPKPKTESLKAASSPPSRNDNPKPKSQSRKSPTAPPPAAPSPKTQSPSANVRDSNPVES